jgi:hypothetical protein
MVSKKARGGLTERMALALRVAVDQGYVQDFEAHMTSLFALHRRGLIQQGRACWVPTPAGRAALAAYDAHAARKEREDG